MLLLLSIFVASSADAKYSFKKYQFQKRTTAEPSVEKKDMQVKPREPNSAKSVVTTPDNAPSATIEKKQSAQNEAEKKKEKAKELPIVLDAAGAENVEKIFLNSKEQCFIVEFALNPGEGISCREPLAIKYTERDCQSSEKKEIGKTNALTSCEVKDLYDIKFKTSKDVVHAKLKVRRTNKGRSGTKSSYQVDSYKLEKPDFFDFMPKPEVLPLDGTKPEEAPVTFKYSGFVALEYEKTEGYGFDVEDPDQGNFNVLSNINFELSRDRNHLTAILEVGEIFSGDDESGGRIGAGGNGSIELRNLYLTHDFYESLSLKGGRVTTNSEPRGFIFSDHIFSMQLAYKSDLSEGIIWYGDAKSNRPQNSQATTEERFSDEYFGSSGTLGFLSRFKCTGFSLYRKYRAKTDQIDTGDGDFSASADLYWVGGTIDYDGLNPIAFQGTYIFNWGHVGANSDTVSSSHGWSHFYCAV